mmetsp:Transcript_12125/g.30697  ORF Transcript_12125/g.30697 Transcript_12125/m.30697 type:complete len:310 (+) Transcript_12125:144-1073(+)
MKSTEGESRKKTAVKSSVSTSKRKRGARARVTARKSSKAALSAKLKKKASTTKLIKKKPSDASKKPPTKRRGMDLPTAKKKKTEEPSTTKQNRRSERTRNNSFNYEEASDDNADLVKEVPYEYRRSAKDNNSSNNNNNKDTKKKKKKKSKTDNNDDEEDNWVTYDQGTAENDKSWNEHYRRLQEFHSEHGHSGVDVNLLLEAEPDFCEWVSRQRQLFREIRCGYRIASLREEGRWKRLRVLNFPLEYEHWLWQRRYNQLSEALDGSRYTKESGLPSLLKDWVDRQMFLMECGRIESERKRELKKLGIMV